MRYMIASDIHGSAFYCRKMLDAYEREGADRLVLLGDLLYHGPRNDLPKDYAPKEVLAMLNARKKDIFCVRGNCDTEVDQMVLEFPMMAEYCLLELDGQLIYVMHGHQHNMQHPPMLKKGDILLTGHTHIPACEDVLLEDGTTFMYLNPGSVSIPKEHSAHSYMIVENRNAKKTGKEVNSEIQFEWKNLDGEVYKRWKTDSHC